MNFEEQRARFKADEERKATFKLGYREGNSYAKAEIKKIKLIETY
ncbi:hypothetical protein [Cytobacillus massiliigabonensis]|nr:hypothetical protein [Cytobacillus massiliigabonensis]